MGIIKDKKSTVIYQQCRKVQRSTKCEVLILKLSSKAVFKKCLAEGSAGGIVLSL